MENSSQSCRKLCYCNQYLLVVLYVNLLCLCATIDDDDDTEDDITVFIRCHNVCHYNLEDVCDRYVRLCFCGLPRWYSTVQFSALQILCKFVPNCWSAHAETAAAKPSGLGAWEDRSGCLHNVVKLVLFENNTIHRKTLHLE